MELNYTLSLVWQTFPFLRQVWFQSQKWPLMSSERNIIMHKYLFILFFECIHVVGHSTRLLALISTCSLCSPPISQWAFFVKYSSRSVLHPNIFSVFVCLYDWNRILALSFCGFLCPLNTAIIESKRKATQSNHSCMISSIYTEGISIGFVSDCRGKDYRGHKMVCSCSSISSRELL